MLSSPPSQYRNIAFFEGYNLQRDCLYQDIGQVDFSSYTHVYFSFGVLSPSYQVQIPNVTTQYEFSLFKQMSGAKRILSIGGWDFSTQPATYNIFRSGVTAANRLTMATNIANFINDNELDGINIDWEYPGVRILIPTVFCFTLFLCFEIFNNTETCPFCIIGTRYSWHPPR